MVASRLRVAAVTGQPLSGSHPSTPNYLTLITPNNEHNWHDQPEMIVINKSLRSKGRVVTVPPPMPQAAPVTPTAARRSWWLRAFGLQR